MSAIDRERVKRAMGIGDYPGQNDLNQNAYRIERFIHAHGQKYPVTTDGDLYCTQVVPGRITYGATLEDLRENAEWILNRAKEEAGAASGALY